MRIQNSLESQILNEDGTINKNVLLSIIRNGICDKAKSSKLLEAIDINTSSNIKFLYRVIWKEDSEFIIHALEWLSPHLKQLNLARIAIYHIYWQMQLKAIQLMNARSADGQNLLVLLSLDARLLNILRVEAIIKYGPHIDQDKLIEIVNSFPEHDYYLKVEAIKFLDPMSPTSRYLLNSLFKNFKLYHPVRVAALYTLFKSLKDDEIIEIMLKDPSHIIRKKCITLITDMTPDVVSVLTKVAETDSDEGVRKKAKTKLRNR